MTKQNQTDATLPTFEQMVSHALKVGEKRLEYLMDVQCRDDEWDDDDSDASFAVELVLSHIRRMREERPRDHCQFSSEWMKCIGALNLANKSLSRSDSWYGRSLKSTCRVFITMPEIVANA